jgi:tetratricopeptide (TPR) repeat protein
MVLVVGTLIAALLLLRTARSLPAKNHWDAVGRGWQYLRMGSADRAFETVSDIRDEAPGSGEAMAIAGLALARLGEYRAARMALERALTLQPNQYEAAVALADLHLGLGNGRRGLVALEKAARLRPGELQVWLRIAKVQNDLGDYPKAVQAFEKALALDPGNRAALAGLIKCFLIIDQSEAAETWLKQGLATYPDDAELLGYAARAAVDTGRPSAAISLADQALAREPANVHALLARARASVGRARWDEALRDAERAVAAEPSDPSALQLLLKIEARLGLKERAAATRARGDRARERMKAMDELSGQIALHPDDPKLLWKMGETARESGSYLLASRCYQAALALEPSFQPARDGLAQVGAGRPDRLPPASVAATGIAPARLLSNGTPRGGPETPSPIRFTEVARQAGISFCHFSGITEKKYMPTGFGSGAAIFDYDNDGKLDLYFATATLLPLGTARAGPNRLYKNLGAGRFQDVTDSSGLGFVGFCHSIVVGDIDNDGDQDVFLCNYGPNALFLNEGNGRFRDISKRAGIDRPNWSLGGAFLDYDQDGDLDLYVANYGQWQLPEDDRYCTDGKESAGTSDPRLRTFCSPKSIRPAKHFLYRNNGDLTFTDVTDAAGVGRGDGRGFGVVAADINGDGRIDLYVANDQCPNFVFLNLGGGRFLDVTESSGAGFDAHGLTRAGMGVDAEDVDGDGRPDLLVTNYWNEPNSLFINLGDGIFEDRTSASGMAVDSYPWVGWGCALADFDNDGWQDCFVANGHYDNNLELFGHNSPYAQPPLLHRNVNGKRFALATREAGPYFAASHAGRGSAFGDLDDDGDIDIVVNQMDGRPALLRNDTSTTNHWLRLVLVGTVSNRDAVGTKVEVELKDRTIWRQRKGGASLYSAHDPRLLIGIGQDALARRVTIRWPSGRVTRAEHLAANRTYRFNEPRDAGPGNLSRPSP